MPLFFRRGDWRAQDRRNVAFVVASLVHAGLRPVIVNEALSPPSTPPLDEVVETARAASAWTAGSIAGHGADPGRSTLSGRAVDVHLAAARLSCGLPADLFKDSAPVKGIQDPAPARCTSVNGGAQLADDVIARHDCERIPPPILCPTWIAAPPKVLWHWSHPLFYRPHHLLQHGGGPAVIVSPDVRQIHTLDQFRHPRTERSRALRAVSGCVAPGEPR